MADTNLSLQWICCCSSVIHSEKLVNIVPNMKREINYSSVDLNLAVMKMQLFSIKINI